ncbi:MAG TPA: hypothetical protein VNS12_00885 [Pelagibacterium sp.]|uniref:hypothetical protein n=1 Tax=Pelagibacterium sp. TaxID=1967288 RepID=UPI002BD3D936|nr:hypothetical protein [Pelagibacterium sp.]HWJ86609.1 hypothetical protein [Pelagibacterium sp.]
MSDLTRLSDLARFEPRSPFASSEEAVRDDALRALARGLEPRKPVGRRVSDMLSVVLAISARTRRMVLPRVSIDVDVFGPNGQRALRMYLPHQD